jgi:DnaJ-class molecular chaperone
MSVLQVDLVNALVGFETVIKHVDERDVKLSKPTVTSHGEVQRVKGQGMPKRSSGFGDLVVTWEVGRRRDGQELHATALGMEGE